MKYSFESMITKSLSFFKDISRFECRNRSDFYKVLIDSNHFVNRGRHLLPKTYLAVSYLWQMHILLLPCPFTPLLCRILQEMLCIAQQL